MAAGLAGAAGAARGVIRGHRTRLLGTAFSTPLCVAPTGFQRLAHPDGELAMAAGVARACALFVLSTRSTCRIEDVAEAARRHGGTWWFQVYLMRDRALTEGLVRRAAMAPVGAASVAATEGIARCLPLAYGAP